MTLSEQRYREWCERMTKKAASENSLNTATNLERPPGHGVSHSKDTSDAESLHSTHTRPRDKFATPKPTRRRTLSDPDPAITNDVCPRARMATWPRSAHASISHTGPAVPRRRSSHFSTAHRRRPDLAAFHRESCQLFSSMDATITDSGYSSAQRSGNSSFASTTSIAPLPLPGNASPGSPTAVATPSMSTVVSWKSDETRRIEYEKIDKAHSGIRGLSKKLLPSFCQSKRCWRNFFSGKCDGGSVRRMRMPFSDDDDDNDDGKSET